MMTASAQDSDISRVGNDPSVNDLNLITEANITKAADLKKRNSGSLASVRQAISMIAL
jgi:hypothetical protein